MQKRTIVSVLAALLLASTGIQAYSGAATQKTAQRGSTVAVRDKDAPDPDFFIYLCIGQSNMEAGATPAEQDKDFNDPRFQFLAAVDMPNLGREMGHWYTAVPPICREGNNLGPVDFFARKMISELPERYRVGVINVSVAGAKIELWDKDDYKEYIDNERDWMKAIVSQYGGNPYKRLIDMARIAQKDGVIKGILMHQGESNSEDPLWPQRVKRIYDNICRDLGLDPEETPLLAGELKYAEEGGVCAAFNSTIMPELPKVLPQAHIISALGCESTGDQFHFNTEGMRLLGYRFADRMLQLQGFKPVERRQLSLKPSKMGIEISPTLSGIFFEDINNSLDGGICAQLIQNNSFQAYDVPGAPENEFSLSDTLFQGWSIIRRDGARGHARLVSDKPLVDLKKHYDHDPSFEYGDVKRYTQYCVRFEIENAGEGFGIAANGYGISEYGRGPQYHYSNDTRQPSIPVEKGVGYDLGLYLRGEGYKGSFKVFLEDNSGELNSNVLVFDGIPEQWKKCEGRLDALRSLDSRLCIEAQGEGVFYLDFVTLLPEPSRLWNEGKSGPFRKDMMQALADLHPKFMRFPGGCASEGPAYFGQVFWKNSIGKPEERTGFRNHWGYWSSQYVGFYEYFLMAESLGATPLPVLNNGVTCQFAGHQYIAPLDTEEDRRRFYSIYVKDALDLIEFCNGPADSGWGAVRAQMGHPEPFGLKYLGIGNENRGEEFWERFGIIYDAVKAAYPGITIVSTAGASDSGKEFDANMSIIDSKYPDTIVDEHYYKSDDWFYANTGRYAPGSKRGAEGLSYDRKRPGRVFVGEFANSRTNNAYASTLAEAAYWTGLERNSDMVVMAAYAPLFCKKGYNKWNSNLIWFDNRGLWRTSNYYYQKLFSQAGDRAIGISAPLDGKQVDSTIFTSPTIDSATGVIYLKFVNSEAVDKEISLKTGNGREYRASLEFISSHNTEIRNQKDQNYYSSHPDFNRDPMESVPPGLRERPGMREMAWRFAKRVNYTEAVVPQNKDLGTVCKSFVFTMPENSVGVLKLTPVESR